MAEWVIQPLARIATRLLRGPGKAAGRDAGKVAIAADLSGKVAGISTTGCFTLAWPGWLAKRQNRFLHIFQIQDLIQINRLRTC